MLEIHARTLFLATRLLSDDTRPAVGMQKTPAQTDFVRLQMPADPRG